MSWHHDQAEGEAALRRLEKEARELPGRFEALQRLVKEMWEEAPAWHGEDASSHYRSKLRERAAALGVHLK